MAKLGTVFVELSLDDKIYKQKLSENLTSTEATAKGIETSWKTLGTRSDAVFDAQRRSYENALTLIKNSTTSTTQDIIRAEEAKNAKLKQLNEQQYGSHKTLMQQITDSTTAHFSAAIIGSQMVMRAVDMIGSAITGAFSKGFNAVEEYNLSVASMAAMVVTFTERAKGMTFAEHWKEALEYSQGIVPVLENIAAKTLLSGQETTALANAFARAGVFLDANNQKQIESFTRISNALPVMTKGQEIMKQINSEIRAVMTGSQESTSMMLQTLKAIDPEIEKHLKAWRAEGTVLENIGELLVGFGPATALLENQWQAVKSTIDTTVTQVLRGGMQGAYNEIISSTQEINKWLEENKDVIQSGIAVGWSIVSNAVSTTWNILAGFGPMLKDVGELVGVIAYGWGGVFAVMKPIGAFLGNSITLVYEMGKALGNIIVMSGALATGQLTLAKTTYDESKKSWDKIVELSEQNRTILTDGISNAITGHEQQAKASQTAQDKIRGHITGTAKIQKEVDKERATALKHANEQIEKDLNKLTLTVEEQIQEQADKWERLGVNKTKIQEWTSAKMAEINQKEAEKVLKIQQAANEQIAQHRRKATDDYEKLMSEEADFAMNENERAMAKITAQEQDKLWKINVMLQEETISWEQYELARTQITANAAANRLEKEFNEAKRRADINYSAIQNIKGMEEEAYQMRIAQIDAEAAKRIKDGGDAVLLAKWVADEQQKAYIQMGKAGDDWTAGVQAALLELTRQHTTWGNTAYEVTKTFTDEAKTQLSDNFFNLFKGNINELGFDWDTMWDKMLQTLSKKIADMVIEAASHDILLLFKSEWVSGGSEVIGIVSKVLGFAGDLFGGSGSSGYDYDWTDGLGFARGGLVPGVPSGVDSVHAMLAPGEFVIPSSLVSLASQGRSGDTMLAHINPAEAKILKMLGGSGTINPRTGLPEFYDSKSGGISPNLIAKAQKDLAVFHDEMDKIASNLLIAQEAKAKGYPTLFEGENLVYISGYRGGEPLGGRTWAPTTALDTSAGSRYYIPLDLLLGGAVENSSGKWIFPYLKSGAVDFLQTLSTMNAPSSWPASAGIPGTWGAIDNPTHGFYVTADQYRNIYAGGYWVPSNDMSWLGVSENGIPVSVYVGGWGGLGLSNDGWYRKRWGGEDIWGVLGLNAYDGTRQATINQP